MKKLVILASLIIVGCTTGPMRQDYQSIMDEKVASPFFYVPPLNKKDFSDRNWILLAESKNKNWFYDPYTLIEDEEGIITFDAFIAPREINNLPQFNPTIEGPYRQKIDCFSNNQWSETFYTQNIISKGPLVGDIKPVNGSGWVKIAPKTAMAYVRSRLCGRKFIDDQNVNYFLYQEGSLPAPLAKKAPVDVFDEKENKQLSLPAEEEVKVTAPEKIPVFYEVINNEITIIDRKKNIRQLKVSSYLLDKNFAKQEDFILVADCQSRLISFGPKGSTQKWLAVPDEKNAFAAVGFNRACGDHGAYMKMINKSAN
jgi:hypothetical protein